MSDYTYLTRKEILDLATSSLSALNTRVEELAREIKDAAAPYADYPFGYANTDPVAPPFHSVGLPLSEDVSADTEVRKADEAYGIPQNKDRPLFPELLTSRNPFTRVNSENRRRLLAREDAVRSYEKIFVHPAYGKTLYDDFQNAIRAKAVLSRLVSHIAKDRDPKPNGSIPLHAKEIALLEGKTATDGNTVADFWRLFDHGFALKNRETQIFKANLANEMDPNLPSPEALKQQGIPNAQIRMIAIINHLKARLAMAERLKNQPNRQNEVEWNLHGAVDEFKTLKRGGIGRLLVHRANRTAIEQQSATAYSDLLRRLAAHFPVHSTQVDQYNPARFERKLMAHLERHPFAYHQIKAELLDVTAAHWLHWGDSAMQLLKYLDDDAVAKIKDRAAELSAKGDKGRESQLVHTIEHYLILAIQNEVSEELYGKNHDLWNCAPEERDAVHAEIEKRIKDRSPSILKSWQQYEKSLDTELILLLQNFSKYQGSNVMPLRFNLFREVGDFNDPSHIPQHKARLIVLASKMFGEFEHLIHEAVSTEGRELATIRSAKFELFHATIDAYRHLYGLPPHQTHYILEDGYFGASYGRTIKGGEIINQYTVKGIEFWNEFDIMTAAGHEATHELQTERVRQGKAFAYADIMKVREKDVPRTGFTIISQSTIRPLVIKKSNGETVEVKTNAEQAQAVNVSPELQRILYAQSGGEREANGVTSFLGAQLLKHTAKTHRDTPSEGYYQRREIAARAQAAAAWAPDRAPERFVGPPTGFLREVDRLLLK